MRETEEEPTDGVEDRLPPGYRRVFYPLPSQAAVEEEAPKAPPKKVKKPAVGGGDDLADLITKKD